MGLSRTVSEINGEFSRKSQFSHPRNAPADGFPLELGIGAKGQKLKKKTRMMGQKVLR